MATKTKETTDVVTIIRALDQASRDSGKLIGNGEQVKELSRQEMAKLAGHNLRPARVGELRSAQAPKTPTLTEAVLLAAAAHLSIEELIDRKGEIFPQQRDGIAWRLAGVPRGTRASACRIAIARLLAGESPEEIRAAVEVVYASRGVHAPPLGEPNLRDMAQGGLAMGLARFETLPDSEARAHEDQALAAQLEDALAGEALATRREDGASDHDRPARNHRPVVRVVKNVAHPDFALDPVAPFLIARVAHEIVAEHIREHETVYEIGLAGGTHCATFVRTIGPESSPFPDHSGDKQLTFVPLTLEPFTSHQLPMADVVVGQMVAEARCLLGMRRVDGHTLQSFGYVVDERVDRLDDAVLTLVRQKYRDLDVAIYGCGDLESDGWLERVVRRVTIADDVAPATDVCLNLLAEDGTSIRLPKGREFVGISLADIRRLVERRDRLALLLTSGRAKGGPMVAAARAGCAGTIVCDQAAARAALEVLGADGAPSSRLD